MASLSTSRIVARALCAAPVALIVASGHQNSRAQRIEFAPTAPIELVDATLHEVGADVANELMKIRELMLGEQWDEVVDLLTRLIDSSDDGLVKLTDNRCIALRQYCHMQIGQFPPPALRIYRDRVDGLAEAWLREGVDSRDASRLREIVESMFCSSFGDDALWALGELALEQGDYAEARNHWERISPRLRGPNGRPLWIALRGIDLERHWDDVAAALSGVRDEVDWFAYPDTDLDLASVQARLILVSIREEAYHRAEVELAAFTKRHPDATGRLGGRDTRLADALSKTLSAARSWPRIPDESNWRTYGRETTRNSVAPTSVDPIAPIWTKSIGRQRTEETREFAGMDTSEPQYFPVVREGVVYYCDAERVYAVQLETGEPAFTETGVLFSNDNGHEVVDTDRRTRSHSTRRTMTIHDGRLYAVMGGRRTGDREGRAQANGDDRLIGLDVASGGRLVFDAPGDAGWSFDGAPIVDAHGVHVAMRHRDLGERVYIASFDERTGRMKWRTLIASGIPPIPFKTQSNGCGLLTQAGSTLFINTNLGVIAAVSASKGEILWIARYDRLAAIHDTPGDRIDRRLAPCVYHDGLLIVAPTDCPYLFALDSLSGQTLWVAELPDDGVQLIGAVGDNLIATGNRVWWIDTRVGSVVGRWPELDNPADRGFGRGAIAGNRFYWPTLKNRLLVFPVNPSTPRDGGVNRIGDVDLAEHGVDSGNIVFVGDRVLVAARDTIFALSPAPRAKENVILKSASNTSSIRFGLDVSDRR